MSQVPQPPYGTPPTQSYATPPGGGAPTSGKAIASLILGILSLGLCCVWWLSIPLGVVAVILGVMAKGEADQGRAGGRGLALAGLILGAIGAALALILFIAAMVGGPRLGSYFEEKMREAQQQQQQDDDGTTDTDTTDTDTDTDDTTTIPPAAPPPAPQ
jgi:hypothetical protein